MWETGSAALNNCGFCSTQDIVKDPAWPFGFVMDMSMLGVGVGFDTRGANKVTAVKPHDTETTFVIGDTRESWVDSLRELIESFTTRPELGTVHFDYSLIRPAGTPIKGFGGKASGPDTLKDLHKMVRAQFHNILRRKSQLITSVDIVDFMNFIGRCVVAGNVRRSSEIALGDPADWDYMQMKDKTLFSEQLNSHRWASNNSIFAKVGMDYRQVAGQIADNGEPGCLWLDNVQNYGRTVDGRQEGIDKRALGTNPCGEQSLEDAELCCLCETFPAHHDDVADYHRTLKFAYLYAKTVTLLPTHCKKTNSVLLRNRRIGLSQSGIIQAFAKFGRRQVLADFCNKGYDVIRHWDEIYSEWLCVSKSLKCTSVKPSGSVSLLAGATAGIHFTIAPTRSYWRNVRVSSDSKLLNAVIDAGYHVEKCVTDDKTSIVRFGVSEPAIPSVAEVSIWQQMKNAVDMQRYWADNQVSCTIQFKPGESKDLPYLLEAFDDELKGISFLPYEDHGYPQAPYQPATPEEVTAYNAKLKPLDFDKYFLDDAVGTKFCDGDSCSTGL
jgi:adenosylcobalamin-dependent ribonucleoside-triphosphate reductase